MHNIKEFLLWCGYTMQELDQLEADGLLLSIYEYEDRKVWENA